MNERLNWTDIQRTSGSRQKSLGSSQACGPGGSGERFRWKGRLPILWCRCLNPRQWAQDFEGVTKYCFLKKTPKNQKLLCAGVRTLSESVLLILLRDVEGIWSGLSLQKLGDQLLEGQAYDWHSALDGKQIQRKSVPSGVYMAMYHIVSADHFNDVFGKATNAWWVVCFCQFLWVVRWLNVWLLNCQVECLELCLMVGIMLWKAN